MRKDLCFAVLALLALSACSPRHQGPSLRLRYWGDLDEIAITEELCRNFEKAHPGVKVIGERKSSDGYNDILLQELAAGTAPDVIFLGFDNVDKLAALGKVEDLRPFLQGSSTKETDYYPAAMERASRGGHLNMLPRDVAPVAVIYYNKALFDQAKLPYPKDDWTWEDLRKAAKALTQRDPSGLGSQFGFGDEWNLWDAWVLSAGGKIVDDDVAPKRFTLASGASAKGLRMRWELQQLDKVMPNSSDQKAMSGGTQALFLNGKLAMFHTGIWKTPGFRKITAFQWDVVRFPTMKGAQDPRFILAGSGYAMRQGLSDPKLAWELILHLAGPTGQKRMASTGLTQPALRELAASPVFLDGQDPKNKKMLLYAAEHGRTSSPWDPTQEFYKTVWAPKMDAVWAEGFSGDPLAVAKAAEAEGNQRFFSR